MVVVDGVEDHLSQNKTYISNIFSRTYYFLFMRDSI